MKTARSLVLALALALCLPAGPSLAGEARVCQGFGCMALPSLTREEIAAWIAQNRIRGLDPDHWAAGPIMELAKVGGLAVAAGDTLNPDAPVTLWQAARAMLLHAKQPVDGLTPRQMVERAVVLQLIPGPVPAEDRPLTRLEAAGMAATLGQFAMVVHRLQDYWSFGPVPPLPGP